MAPANTVEPFADSLCRRCGFLQLVKTKRGSAFLKCSEPTLSAVAKYPRQPVTSCDGFAAGPGLS